MGEVYRLTVWRARDRSLLLHYQLVNFIGMKSLIKILMLLLVPVLTIAQQHLPDIAVHALKNASNDSVRYHANHEAYFYFEEIIRDSALYYTEKCLALSKKNSKQLVTVRNTGVGALNVQAPTLSGAAAADFTATVGSCFAFALALVVSSCITRPATLVAAFCFTPSARSLA